MMEDLLLRHTSTSTSCSHGRINPFKQPKSLDTSKVLFMPHGRTRLPNGPGRLASFGAPNDGPVRGMHFGGLVRPGTESEYLGPDIDDCSFRIRF